MVLMITSVKEGIEDLKRAKWVPTSMFLMILLCCCLNACRNDKEENFSEATVVTFENGVAKETVIDRQDVN